MRLTLCLCALFLGGPGLPAPARSQPEPLTAERVVALARARAPEVRSAESEVLAARGKLASARAFGRENPTIEGVANRDQGFERRMQWEMSVPVGIGLHWLGRNGEASAELQREQSRVADARRGAVGAALAAYYRLLHAGRRVELAEERRALAADLLRTASERHRAGDAPRLELLLTEIETSRAGSELRDEERSLARSRVELAARLGLPLAALAVGGSLADLGVLTSSSPAATRADVRAAESELRAARAARGLARGEWLPGLAFRLNYGHEAGEPLVQPGLAVTVPLFQHGQESGALARARESRAAAELERLRNASASEVEGFREAYRASLAAADELGTRALPKVEVSESMVKESYAAGKIDLPSLLVVRRELLDTRREHVDRMLAAALAGIDLAVAEGRFQ